MSVFTSRAFFGHEQVHFWNDQSVGLQAIAAIHRVRPNNAIGGCRMYPYANEHDALADVLKLSRAMSYKCAMANIEMGGGKCVIIGDPAQAKSDKLLQSMGRFINSLNGQFYTGEDVGIGVQDVAIMRRETKFLVGREGADSSSVAAYGVYIGILASLRVALGDDSLKGRTVSIQGLGQVGLGLARHLHEAGANLIVADVNPEPVKHVVKNFNAKAVSIDKILFADCDVLSPCALGGILDAEITDKLKCKIVAGAANNQLKHASVASLLQRRGILYAPDYVINAGGVINNALTLSPDFSTERVRADTARIGETLQEVFARAATDNLTTDAAAALIAEERMTARDTAHSHT
jgi:leucine dehydrogenase